MERDLAVWHQAVLGSNPNSVYQMGSVSEDCFFAEPQFPYLGSSETYRVRSKDWGPRSLSYSTSPWLRKIPCILDVMGLDLSGKGMVGQGS